MQVLPEQWIKVHLKPEWQSKVLTIKPKVYALGINAKQLMDKTFDEMQYLGYLKFTSFYMLFSFPIFMVRK